MGIRVATTNTAVAKRTLSPTRSVRPTAPSRSSPLRNTTRIAVQSARASLRRGMRSCLPAMSRVLELLTVRREVVWVDDVFAPTIFREATRYGDRQAFNA